MSYGLMSLRTGHGVCVLFLSTLLPSPTIAQPVRCQLRADVEGDFSGTCSVGTESIVIQVSRPAEATDALWSGTMTGRSGEGALEISTYQYSSGPELIVRTGAWHQLAEFVVSGDGLLLAWDESVQAPPSETDLQILQAARDLLSSEDVWDRADDRNCENDDHRISLYCALAQATASAMGRYQHRQPAMQVVRRVIRSEWSERVVDHRLMNFNNDERTTLSDVDRLFDLSLESLRREVR